MRVVAWHNRHPFASPINVSQVHSIGEVVLPFASATPLPSAPARGSGASAEMHSALHGDDHRQAGDELDAAPALAPGGDATPGDAADADMLAALLQIADAPEPSPDRRPPIDAADAAPADADPPADLNAAGEAGTSPEAGEADPPLGPRDSLNAAAPEAEPAHAAEPADLPLAAPLEAGPAAPLGEAINAVSDPAPDIAVDPSAAASPDSAAAAEPSPATEAEAQAVPGPTDPFAMAEADIAAEAAADAAAQAADQAVAGADSLVAPQAGMTPAPAGSDGHRATDPDTNPATHPDTYPAGDALAAQADLSLPLVPGAAEHAHPPAPHDPDDAALQPAAEPVEAPADVHADAHAAEPEAAEPHAASTPAPNPQPASAIRRSLARQAGASAMGWWPRFKQALFGRLGRSGLPKLQATFNRDFIWPLRPGRVARWAQRHGAMQSQAPADWPRRVIESDAALLANSRQKGMPHAVPLHVLTAAIGVGDRRLRVLIDANGSIIGPRAYSRPRLATATALLSLGLAGGTWQHWRQTQATLALARGQTVMAAAAAASAAADAASAAVLVTSVEVALQALGTSFAELAQASVPAMAASGLADGQAALVDHAASAPDTMAAAQPTGHAEAQAADPHAAAATQPGSHATASITPPPAANGSAAHAAPATALAAAPPAPHAGTEPRARADDHASAANPDATATLADGPAAAGAPSGTSFELPVLGEIQPKLSAGEKLAARLRSTALRNTPPSPKPVAPNSGRVYAVVTLPVPERDLAALNLKLIRASGGRLDDDAPEHGEILGSKNNWRAAWWPFANQVDAERARVMLAGRGLKVEVVEF